jgi:ribonuclease HI
LDIYTDGSSKNPGDSSIGVAIYKNGHLIKTISKYVGIMTCNMTEYAACVVGLKYAVKNKALMVNLYSDSKLMIMQLSGEYKIKNKGLMPFYVEAKKLIEKIKVVHLIHIPREENKIADGLASKGIKYRIIVWR